MSKEANRVVLLSPDHRHFSRSGAIQWYLDCAWKQETVFSSSAAVVESVVLDGEKVVKVFHEKTKLQTLCSTAVQWATGKDKDRESSVDKEKKSSRVLVSGATEVSVVFCKYRVVFSLDLSPSLAALDWEDDKILFDRVVAALEDCLRDLLQPLSFPESGLTVVPEFYVSVIAQGMAFETFKVIVQGAAVTLENVEELLRQIKAELWALEKGMSVAAGEKWDGPNTATLSNMIQTGMFALDLLPVEACPALVLVTDGVATLPNNIDALLLNREEVACFTIFVGSNSYFNCPFGYFPDPEILQFLSSRTGGYFFNYTTSAANPESRQEMREKLLFRTVKYDLSYPFGSERVPPSAVITLDTFSSNSLMDVNYPFPWEGYNRAPLVPLFTKVVRIYALDADLSSVTKTRMFEGFVLQDLNVNADTMEVKLLLYWQQNIFVGYNIEQSLVSKSLSIKIRITGYYELVQQYFTPPRIPAHSTQMLKEFVEKVAAADGVLSYVFSQLTPTKQPLFQSPDTQYGPKLFSQAIQQLNDWNKWLTIEKVEFALNPRLPPSTLQTYHDLNHPKAISFSFGSAADHIESIISNWCTYTCENNVFVKLFPTPETLDSLAAPTPFCAVRLTWETRNMGVIQLGFFHVPVAERTTAVMQLKSVLSGVSVKAEDSRGNSYQTVLFHKPFRPILVQYETSSKLMKSDFLPLFPSIPSTPTHRILSHYMLNKSWMWLIDSKHMRELALELIIRARFNEGYTLLSHLSTMNFLKEIELESLPSGKRVWCVAQYVIFMVAPDLIVTQLWVEPQWGHFPDHESKHFNLFDQLKAWIYARDLDIISSLTTFAKLLAKAHPKDNTKTTEKAGVEKIPFSVGSIISSGRRWQHTYSSFSQSTEHSATKPIELLYSLLKNALHFSSDFEVTLEQSDAKLAQFYLNDCFCCAKIINNLTVTFAFLDPLQIYGPHFSISFFECSIEALKQPQAKSEFFAPTSQEMEMSTVGVNPSEPASMSSRLFCEAIREAHTRNLVKVLYTHLRDGTDPIPLRNFEQVVSKSCQEYTLEIDLSEYFDIVNKQELTVGMDRNQESVEVQDVQSRFNSIIGQSFSRISGKNYCFFSSLPQETNARQVERPGDDQEEDELDLDDDYKDEEEETDFWEEDDLLQSKGNKRNEFIGSVTPRLLGLSLHQKTPLEIYPFPFFLRMECDLTAGGQYYKFPITTIPTRRTHPVLLSGSRTSATLRFVCVTIPPGNVGQTSSLPLSHAPLADIRRIMKETGNAIQSLLAQQMLQALRTVRPITKPMLDLVMHQMNCLTSPSLFAFTVPLSFLNMREGRKIFPLELESATDLSLTRLDAFYFMSEKSRPSARHPSHYVDFQLPFWLIITYHQSEGAGDLLKVYFHGNNIPRVERSRIFSKVRAGVRRVCERTNKLVLLSELHDTRICSPLLVPESADARVSSQRQKDSKESQAVNGGMRGNFSIGEFSCSCVWSCHLPIQSRVPASMALNYLHSTAFLAFSVTNRKSLFVFREKSAKVFYFRLFDSPRAKLGELESIVANSPYSNSFVTLEVFGIDKPGYEITNQLRVLLENQLAIFTLGKLSDFLERNPKLKLTPEDIEFMRGPHLSPLRELTIAIPPSISAQLYVVYLKQNLLRLLLPMYVQMAVDGLQIQSPDSAPSQLVKMSSEFHQEINSSLECSLIYNNNGRGASQSQSYASIGQGIALVQISLAPLVGFVPHSAPLTEEARLNLCLKSVEYCESPTFTEEAESENGSGIQSGHHVLSIKIWAREIKSLHLSALTKYMIDGVNQTLLEYGLEKHYLSRRIPIHELHKLFLEPCSKIFSHGRELHVPSIHQVKLDLSLSSWSLHNFVAELQDILVELNPKLYPVICFCEDRFNYRIYSITRNKQAKTLLPVRKHSSHFALIGGNIQMESDEGSEDLARNTILLEDSDCSNDSMLYPHIQGSQDTTYRNCCILLTLTPDDLTAFTYNWAPSKVEQFQTFVTRLKSWTSMRKHLLTNILHQKMGLFYHLPSMSSARSSATINAGDVIKFTLDEIDLLLNNTSPARRTEANSNAARPISKSATLKKKAMQSQNFDSVLMNSFPSEPLQLSPYSSIVDPVKRHGLQFKAAASHNIRHMEQRSKMQNIYSVWGRLSQPGQAVKPAPNLSSHLRVLVRSSRLLHCSRTPFLLQKHNTEVFTELDEVHVAVNPWYRHLLDTFTREYRHHLTSLGFHEVQVKQGQPNHEKSPEIVEREFFLQKVLRGGLLLIKFGFKDSPRASTCGGFVSCDLFVLRGLKARLSSSNSEVLKYNGSLSKLLTEECIKYQQSLRLNAFLYDFHLRHLQNFGPSLAAYLEVYPMAEIPRVLSNVQQHYPMRPKLSVNQVVSQVLTVHLDQASPLEIFSYLCSCSASFGLIPMMQGVQKGSHEPFLMAQLHDLTGLKDLEEDCQAKLSLFITMLPETVESKLQLQFSVLVSPTEALTREPSTDKILVTVKKELEIILDQVEVNYKRDMLWKTLVSSAPQEPMLTSTQSCHLLELTAFGPVESLDPSLESFLVAPLSWSSLVTHLLGIYGKSIRVLSGKEILVFYPLNQDLFLHVMVTAEEKLKMNIHHKHSVDRKSQEMEQIGDHVSRVVNHALHFIWKQLLIKQDR